MVVTTPQNKAAQELEENDGAAGVREGGIREGGNNDSPPVPGQEKEGDTARSPSAAAWREPQHRRWRELVIGGGGMNGIALLGATQYLYDTGALKSVRRYVGTSVGAVLCLLFILGYRSDVIMGVLCGISFEHFDGIDANSMLSFFDTFGMMTSERFLLLVHAFLRARSVSTDVTFHDLQVRFGCELVITGYNVSQGRLEAFSPTTHPNMRVVRAIEITTCVPLVFRPILHEGDLYVDGGLLDSVPRAFVKRRRRALVLCSNYGRTPSDLAQIPTDVFRFVLLLISRLYDRLRDHNETVYRRRRLHVMFIQMRSPWDLMNFKMDDATKRELHALGYESARLQYRDCCAKTSKSC